MVSSLKSHYLCWNSKVAVSHPPRSGTELPGQLKTFCKQSRLFLWFHIQSFERQSLLASSCTEDRGSVQCVQDIQRGREEKKWGAGQFINRSFAQASLTFTSLTPVFFAFPVPIKDHKMWNWPIKEKRLALVTVHLNFRSIFSWILQLSIIICQLVAISQTEACEPLNMKTFLIVEKSNEIDPKLLTDIWHSSDVSCRLFFWKQNYHNWFSDTNWLVVFVFRLRVDSINSTRAHIKRVQRQGIDLFLQSDYQEFPTYKPFVLLVCANEDLAIEFW